MEVKDIKAAFDDAAKELKDKAEGAEQKALEAIELVKSKFDEVEASQQNYVKSLTEKFEAEVKALQTQHDKLSAKVKGEGSQRAEETKSFTDVLGETLLNATDDIAKFQRKETKNLVLEFKAVGDMTTGNVTGGNRYGQQFAPAIIQNPNRKVHVEDLLPGGNIGPGNSYTFMREKGLGEGNPAPVAEGALKPQFDFDLEEATVQIETIAGWMRVTRKAMANIPGFVAFLQSRIPERFKKVKDEQFLYGDGNTPNLKGILTAGNFKASTYGTTLPLVERITGDIAVLADTYERDATGVLMRPIDILPFYENKATGSGEYDLPRNVTFVGGQLYISGVPVYMSTATHAGDYVVGDWANGAQILTQEAMRIEFFEQDGTNVRENKVTVRVEGNYALPCYGDNYFIKGSTAAVTA